jgi:hypothetical protein
MHASAQAAQRHRTLRRHACQRQVHFVAPHRQTTPLYRCIRRTTSTRPGISGKLRLCHTCARRYAAEMGSPFGDTRMQAALGCGWVTPARAEQLCTEDSRFMQDATPAELSAVAAATEMNFRSCSVGTRGFEGLYHGSHATTLSLPLRGLNNPFDPRACQEMLRKCQATLDAVQVCALLFARSRLMTMRHVLKMNAQR